MEDGVDSSPHAVSPVATAAAAAMARAASGGEERPATGPACAGCGSRDVERVPWAYEAGAAWIDGSAKDTGSAIVGMRLVFPAADVGGTGTPRTLLAQRLAPPERRAERGAAALLVALFTTMLLAAMIAAASHVAVGALLLLAVALLMGAPPFSRSANARWNQEEHPRLMDAWSRSVVCRRCGAVTDPVAPGDDASWTDDEDDEEFVVFPDGRFVPPHEGERGR